MKHFSLNDSPSNLYYSILMLLTIFSIHTSASYLLYKEFPAKKQIQQLLIVITSLIFFHSVVDPSIQVNVLQEQHHNDHIANV